MYKKNSQKQKWSETLQNTAGHMALWGGKAANISAVVCLALCVLFFGFSGLSLTLLEKALLVILSLLCGQLLPWAHGYLKHWGKMPWACFACFCAFVAFAMVGSTLFLYPIGVAALAEAYLAFALAWLWVLPICLCIVAWLHQLSVWMSWQVSPTLALQKSLPKWALFAMCFAGVLVVGVVYVVGYNPAISCADSNYQFAQALGAAEFSDWHAPLHTLIITLLVNVCNEPAFVALMQCAFFAFVYARGALLLQELGMRTHIILVFTAVVVLLRPNSILLITLWKDVPYTAALLWLLLIMAKLILVEKPKPAVWVYVELALCLPLVCLLRLNGIVPAILCAVAVLIMLARRQKIKALGSIAAALVMVLAFNMVLLPAMGIQKENPGGKYIALSQDLFAVEQAGGELPAKAYEYFDVLTETEEEWWYTPYWAFSGYNLDVPMGEFVGVYAEAFVKNPLTMLQSVLLRTEGAWSIKTSPDAWIGLANYSGTIDDLGFWGSQYTPRKDNAITAMLDFLGGWTSQEPFVNLFWRVGWVLALALAACFVAVIDQRKKILWLMVPIVGQYISLALSTGWSDYRYFWPIGLMSIYFVAILLCRKRTMPEEQPVLL